MDATERVRETRVMEPRLCSLGPCQNYLNSQALAAKNGSDTPSKEGGGGGGLVHPQRGLRAPWANVSNALPFHRVMPLMPKLAWQVRGQSPFEVSFPSN